MIIFRIAQIETLVIIIDEDVFHWAPPLSVYKKTNHTSLTNYRAKAELLTFYSQIIFGSLSFF